MVVKGAVVVVVLLLSVERPSVLDMVPTHGRLALRWWQRALVTITPRGGGVRRAGIGSKRVVYKRGEIVQR